MDTRIFERYFFFGLLFGTLLFTFFIFRPFWIVLVLGISFSIVLYPIYAWLGKIRLPNWLASFLTVFLFMIVLCGPLLGIGVIVFNQSENVYNLVVKSDGTEPFLISVNEKINSVLPQGVNFDIKQNMKSFVSYVSGNIANIFSTTVSALFSFVLMLLIIFYFLKDGEKWKKTAILLSPLSDKYDEKIISKLSSAVSGVMKGTLLIALIQGILMGLGLWIFNVPNPALWGVVAAVTSLVPTFGTAFVSVPAIIFLFATHQTGSGIGLLIWASLVVGMIDNFLGPILVGGQTNISPLLILFAVLGGISLLGPVGILIGPLVVSLLYALISIYRNEFKPN